MERLRVAIIEDELPSARLLARFIAELRPNWDLLMLPGNIEESVEWLSENDHPDLIFLDIHLSDGVSFHLIEQAKPNSMIIFTTAYDNYALQAFTVNSVDYLLKPINKDRLLEAICKYEGFSQKHRQAYRDHIVASELSRFDLTTKRYRQRFLVQKGDRYHTLLIQDIGYFYSENKITYAVTKTGIQFPIDLSLDKLMEQLDPDLFFRTSRQSIVSIDVIERIEPYFKGKVVVHLYLPSKIVITVSREKLTAFKLWLNY